MTFSGKPFDEVPHFINSDKKCVFCRYWLPEDEIRGLILVVHGFGEHCSRYDATAEIFNQLGLLTFAHDHVGHGESEGYRTDVTSYEIYLRDLLHHVNIIKEKHPGLPLYLFGHSMGGALAIMLAHRNPDMFKYVILSSPMITKNVAFSSNWKVFLVKHLSPYLPQLPGGYLDASLVSRSPEQVAIYKSDPLVYHGPIKIRVAYQLYLLSELVAETLPDVSFPFLVVHGEKDRLCDIAGSRQLLQLAKSSDKSLKEYKDCYHELMHEKDDVPQQFLNDIKSWLDERIS